LTDRAIIGLIIDFLFLFLILGFLFFGSFLFIKEFRADISGLKLETKHLDFAIAGPFNTLIELKNIDVPLEFFEYHKEGLPNQGLTDILINN
jgi:hypothetical protein